MKPQRPGPKPNVVTKSTTKGKRRTSRGRTSRACDRCRVKKAKCDGAQTCKTCRASDTPCIYSARRREARNYYCQMREVTDSAIQKLYWACRQRTGFPGYVPDEATGTVATTDILKGLGLIKQEFDEFELPKDIEQTLSGLDSTHSTKPASQAIKPRHHGEFNDTQSIVSSPSTFSSPRLSNEQIPTANSRLSASEPTTPHDDFDMKEQFLANSPGTRALQHDSKTRSSEEPNPFFHHADHPTESHHMDVDHFLDISFCTPPSSSSQASYNDYPPMSFGMPPMTTSHFPLGQFCQHPPDLIYDSYLSPWPGSLAAAHQSVVT